MAPDPRTQLEPSQDAWREIEGVFDELAELSRSVVSVRRFCAEFLSRAASGMAASGGALWVRQTDGDEPSNWKREASFSPPDWLTQDWNDDAVGNWLRQVADHRRPQATRLAALDTAGATAASAADTLLIAAPILLDENSIALLVICREGESSPATQRGFVKVAAEMTDLAADYFANHQRRQLLAMEDAWSRIDDFARTVHENLDATATAYAAANESRRLIGCDRATVLLRGAWGFRVAAVSGVDDFDRRSNEIRAVERLANRARKYNDELWSGFGEELPPQLESALQPFVDQTHAKAVALLPLRREPREDSPLIGMLAIECLQTPDNPPALREATRLAARLTAPAMRNAIRFRDLPLRPLISLLEGLRWLTALRRLPYLLIAAALVGGLAWAAVNVPADFEIKARGELQPETRRRVFAPADGIVQALHVGHGDSVSANAELLSMREPALEFEYTRVLGEIQTMSTDLDGVRASRLSAGGDASLKPEEINALASREEQLKQQLENLRAQLSILERQRSDQTVLSPIDGQVVTWDLQRDLTTRPVKRGQALMTIAQTDGPWVIELRVPDRGVRHLLEARKENPKLAVRFMPASEPGKVYWGEIERVALATTAAPGERPAMTVIVRFPRGEVAELHAGATVSARIQCGKRSLGYVWLHGIYERIRLQFFF